MKRIILALSISITILVLSGCSQKFLKQFPNLLISEESSLSKFENEFGKSEYGKLPNGEINERERIIENVPLLNKYNGSLKLTCSKNTNEIHGWTWNSYSNDINTFNEIIDYFMKNTSEYKQTEDSIYQQKPYNFKLDKFENKEGFHELFVILNSNNTISIIYDYSSSY